MKRYYITDRKSAGGWRALLDIIRDQFALGTEYIQIREKDIPARQLFEFTLAVLEERPPSSQTKVLVNSRADIAQITGADGVHLPAAAPRQTLPGLLVFRSCHNLDEVRNAHADAVTFSPVFAAPGKGEPVGLPLLSRACQLGVPVFALGGVTWDNAQSCIAAGAAGVAGIRLFQDPE